MGDGRIFSKKPSTTLPFIKIYRMSLLSAGSILLDSTFHRLKAWRKAGYGPFKFKHFMSVWIWIWNHMKTSIYIRILKKQRQARGCDCLLSWCVLYLVSRAGSLFWEGADQPGPSPPVCDRQGRRGSPDHLRKNSLKGNAHEHTQFKSATLVSANLYPGLPGPCLNLLKISI